MEAVACLKEDIRKFEDQKISLRREITEMSYNVKRKDALEDELSQAHRDLLELEDKFSEKNKEIEATKNSKTRYKKTMGKLLQALINNLKDLAKEAKSLKTTIKQQKTFFKDYFPEKRFSILEEIQFDLQKLFASFQCKVKVEFTMLSKSKDFTINELEKNIYTLKKRGQEAESNKNDFAVQRDNWFSEREELSLKLGEWEEAYGSIEYELSAKIEDQDVQLGG
jgi:predicted  nucleic acid-binding Zn-ribbon protein